MNYIRTTGIILVLSENTDANQLIRSTGSCVKHADVAHVLVVNRTWNDAVQQQMARLPKMHPHRVTLAQTSDPVQELSRIVPGMMFTAVIDSMATLTEGSIDRVVDELNGPGNRAVIGVITARPSWAGAMFRTEPLRRASHGIDMSDMPSLLAAVKAESWTTSKGLEISERPIIDLGRETLRRLPDRLRPVTEPIPRAGSDIINLRSRRRSRR